MKVVRFIVLMSVVASLTACSDGPDEPVKSWDQGTWDAIQVAGQTMPVTTNGLKFDYLNIINSGSVRSLLSTVIVLNAQGVETGRITCNGDLYINVVGDQMTTTLKQQIGTTCGASWFTFTFTRDGSDKVSGVWSGQQVVLKRTLAL